jgi:CheY-like chemotaxis protein
MSSPADARRHCLIAEADPFIASLLVRFAEGSGLECVRARTADDVIELARRVNPAVIIIDAELPGDAIGWEVMRALKLDAATNHIAQISCSWLSEPEVRGLVNTIVGHLQKPDISYSEFERVLRAAGVNIADRRTKEAPSFQAGVIEAPLTNPQTKGQRL